MIIIFVSAKVSVFFQQDQTTITQEDPKGFTWHKGQTHTLVRRGFAIAGTLCMFLKCVCRVLIKKVSIQVSGRTP